MSFRVAGLKILQGCAPYIRKRLKEGELYLLSSRYVKNAENELTLSPNRGEERNLFAETLYDIQSDAHPIKITVSAIVGKNGDGKSTLLEVMLRVLNNFAVTTGFHEDQPSLKYVDGVNAILYYEIDSGIYAIKCEGKEVTWYDEGSPVPLLQTNDRGKKRDLKKHYEHIMFYTMVINYSLYAYTPASLGGEKENDSYWIDGLFHKNDSYQTPVVLNPMRTDGNIDVNREEYLSKQRLMSIFVNSEDSDRIRMVSDTDTAIGYAFSLEKESKFVKYTLSGYLLDRFQDELIWDEILSAEKSEGREMEELIERFHYFWHGFRPELAENPELVKLCYECLSKQRRSRKTDLRKYLTVINNTAYPVNPKTKKRPRNDLGREFVLLVNTTGDLSKLNYRQFYRMLLILLVWRALTENDSCQMKGDDLNETLKERWRPMNAAKLYVVYKFISIVETYNGFCNGYYLRDDKFALLTREWPNQDALGTIRQDLELILNTNDYRTLKLRQALYYLKQNKEYYNADMCDLHDIKYDYFLSFDMMKRQLRGVPLKEIQWRLPCPIFDGDIVLYNQKEYFTLDSLSSGMIQRLNTAGSLIYHLRNLDDEQKRDTMLAYDYVTVVLEEVELYYHPDYQKSYLNYLREQIARAELQRLNCLNLIFITHSPFILSDIIRKDIMCLKDGKPADMEIKTFGANIHDLLRNPFFMQNGTIGDFAQKIINRIIVSLSIYDYQNRHKGAFDLKKFKEEYSELADYMDFLPYEDDGSLDMMNFEIMYSKRSLKEAIILLDEPIVKDALLREYDRIA